MKNNNIEDTANFDESNLQGQVSNSFVVSLISFLIIFVLPFSLTFWPIVVIAIISSLFGVVSGHRARNKVKKTSSSGTGLTIAGLILGYITLAFSSLWLILLILWMSGVFSIF